MENVGKGPPRTDGAATSAATSGTAMVVTELDVTFVCSGESVIIGAADILQVFFCFLGGDMGEPSITCYCIL